MTDVRKHGAVPNDRQPAVLTCHVGHQLLDQHGRAFPQSAAQTAAHTHTRFGVFTAVCVTSTML